MTRDLLTVKEISSFLHVHPKTVYKWNKEGKIPFHVVNGLYRYDIEEIADWREKKHRTRDMPCS